MSGQQPSETQAAALNGARGWGYIRPTSETHAARLGTRPAALMRTVRSCVRAGWLVHDVRGKYVLSEVGAAFFASTADDF